MIGQVWQLPNPFSFAPQMLSPKNKGLFKRAITQSGVGLCSWAIQKDPLYWAKKVTWGSPLREGRTKQGLASRRAELERALERRAWLAWHSEEPCCPARGFGASLLP